MARLRFKNQVPPGQFRYRQKESQLTIHGESLGDLVSRVKAHREHKGFIPTDEPTIQLQIERQICGRLSTNECIAEGTTDDWVPIKDNGDFLDLGKIKAFSLAAWAWIKDGGELVDLAEAKRRAAVCEECPCNSSFEGCKCGPLAKWVSSVIPEDRIIPSLDNRGCAVCSCSLQTLVHSPISSLVASHKARPLDLPVNCWKNGLLK